MTYRSIKGIAMKLYSIVIILCAFFLSSCSKSSEEGNQQQLLKATYESLEKNVFTSVCANCHIPGHPSMLVMYKQDVYTKLVNQKSPIQGKTYITPGDAKNSLVAQYLMGASPSHAPLLPQKTKELIIQWINDGAKRN